MERVRYLEFENNSDLNSYVTLEFRLEEQTTNMQKVRQGRNDFFKPTKKRTNQFYFSTMKPQVDWFSFVFWRKLQTPKRLFEIN